MAEKEYIEREAAIKETLAERDSHSPYTPELCGMMVGAEKVSARLKRIPAADVRPVVLCRECRYAYDSVGGWFCSHGICVDCAVREDFFCADGARMDGDGDV